MKTLVRLVMRRERGATATEYALLIAAAAVIIAAAITLTGEFLDGFWSSLANDVF